MISKELLKKIRRIEIMTSRLVSDVFAGQYHSVFKGQGIEFDEVREYQIGDDIRSIDWNVTARTGRMQVKKFIEERELTVMIIVDVSASSRFGSVNYLKSQMAAEIAALLSLSATRNQDRVGLINFTDRIEKYIAPRKGRQHALRVIRDILYHEPQGSQTDIIGAIDYLHRVTKRKTISFLISDFMGNHSEELLRKSLNAANKRHDLIAIALDDPREWDLPKHGVILLEDAENQKRVHLDCNNQKLRTDYKENNALRITMRDRLFRSIGMDYVNISTDSSYADELARFFIKRRKRK